MMLIFLCAIFGLWLGGTSGLFVGAAIGFVLNRIAQASAGRGLLTAQSQFLDATFAVMGAICKADGVVTHDEIRVTEEVFAQLHLSPEQKQAAKAAFGRGKSPEFDLDAEVDSFAQTARGGGALFQLFLQAQLMAIGADGQVHPAERALLVRVARRLGLGEADVARLEALLRGAEGGAAAASAPPPQRQLDDAHATLGVTPAATEAEIKRAYRKLMSESHPDKLMAKGLPEGMRQLAEKRAREINVAYDLIRKARQFR